MRIAVLTVSDRSFRGEREDAGGPLLLAAARKAGAEAFSAGVVPDERQAIAAKLRELADSAAADVILTTGGTGLAPRDVTPEATLEIADKLVPGLGELMRAASLPLAPYASLSRAQAVVRGQCLIVNLPGRPAGAGECFRIIQPLLGHAVELLRGGRPH